MFSDKLWIVILVKEILFYTGKSTVRVPSIQVVRLMQG